MIKEFDLLKKISKSSTAPHAYIFVGPSDSGKFETAINFAKFLNCQNNEDDKTMSFIENCECDQCSSMQKNIHPDVYIIEKQDGRKEIVDSQIIDKDKKEGIIYKINNSPILGRFNIVIIKDADLMNKTVSNTILKSLEEPKNNTIFILTTTNKKSILETIISRCLVIDFALLNKEEAGVLLGNSSNKDLILDLSSMKYNKILQLKDSAVFDKYISDVKDFAYVLRSKDFEKISYVNKVLENKEDLSYYIYIWELVFNLYLSGKQKDLIGEIKISNIGESIKKLYNIKEAIKGNYILKIGLINFLLDIN